MFAWKAKSVEKHSLNKTVTGKLTKVALFKYSQIIF